jgi:thiol-disulfide isomerase/thioredoxin
MKQKTIVLIAVIALIVGAIWYLQAPKPSSATSQAAEIPLAPAENVAPSENTTPAKPAEQQAAVESARTIAKRTQYERAREITNPSGFINTDGKPIAIKDIIGKKVILIDFWTYSCINCQRTLPYLTSWYAKYKNQGLEIVSIHTPEFEFEKNYDNVVQATKRFGITYPVVLDNDFGTWSAYKNQYWPRKYLIDIDGFIVYDHAGEGAYDEAEEQIQKALKERMDVLGIAGTVSSGIVKPAAESPEAQSPETYFGAARNEYLSNGLSGSVGPQSLQAVKMVARNQLYLTGDWNFLPEFAITRVAGDTITYKYMAKGVYFVGSADQPVQIQVLLDSKPLTGDEAGSDVKDGVVTVQEARLYRLVQNTDVGEHTLQMVVQQPGLKAYTFTFG